MRTVVPAAPPLQVGLACGEVIEMSGDVFGDAVNVAARLIDHAGDNETLLYFSRCLERITGRHGAILALR